jgi:hypothetical protein
LQNFEKKIKIEATPRKSSDPFTTSEYFEISTFLQNNYVTYMRSAFICIPGELGNLYRQVLLHIELPMDAYWMSCCLGVSRLADKRAYSATPEDPCWLILAILFHINLQVLRRRNHHRTAKCTTCESVERSNTAYWQLVTNPCTATDSLTFVMSMNKQPLTSIFFLLQHTCKE